MGLAEGSWVAQLLSAECRTKHRLQPILLHLIKPVTALHLLASPVPMDGKLCLDRMKTLGKDRASSLAKRFNPFDIKHEWRDSKEVKSKELYFRSCMSESDIHLNGRNSTNTHHSAESSVSWGGLERQEHSHRGMWGAHPGLYRAFWRKHWAGSLVSDLVSLSVKMRATNISMDFLLSLWVDIFFLWDLRPTIRLEGESWRRTYYVWILPSMNLYGCTGC